MNQLKTHTDMYLLYNIERDLLTLKAEIMDTDYSIEARVGSSIDFIFDMCKKLEADLEHVLRIRKERDGHLKILPRTLGKP